VKLHRRFADWLRRHAAEDRNSFTVTVAPAQAGRTFQIELPRWSLRVAGAVLIAGFVLVVAGGILYGKLIRDALQLREVREENVQLRARAGRILELESQVAQLDRIRAQLYTLAGVPDTIWSGDAEQGAKDPVSAVVEPAGRKDGTGDASMATASPLRETPFRGPVSRGFSAGREGAPEHTGVDIAGANGSPVLAAGDGRVEFAGWDSTFGNLVVIRHGGGWVTKYGHNTSLLVARGDSVRAGQTISSLGSTGMSSAPHLHFEVVHNGRAMDPGQTISTLRGSPRKDNAGSR
jgi:murein DD-endopeptidase MepM/ murein hydrolase activator NlpD